MFLLLGKDPVTDLMVAGSFLFYDFISIDEQDGFQTIINVTVSSHGVVKI